MKPNVLAWQRFPEPNGLDYTADDLAHKSKVVELFDYCQIQQAAIWDIGWQFLFERYELKGIIEIDSKSDWLDDEDTGEWITSIMYQSLISGYDPLKKEFGKYDESSEIFTNSNGMTWKIDWEEIYNLKEKI